MKRKKYLVGILYIICTLLLFPLQIARAENNYLHKIDMQIVLAEDGSASISEKWSISLSEGTEIYKEMPSMGESTIRDFRVTQKEQEFEILENWEVGASREEKIGKVGIVRKGDDYELCFGISEYDYQEYTMHYTVDKFVAKYQDMYGMNWRLVNQDMDMKPTEIKVSITGHGISADTRMYAFGFEGNIDFQEQDGTPRIVATNLNENDAYGRVNYVNIMLGLPDITFTNAIEKYSGRTFENMFEEAREGSDYAESQDDISGIIWIVVCVFVIGFGVVVLLILATQLFNLYGIKYVDGTRENARKLEVDYFRDIPCNQDPYFFYGVVNQAKIMQEIELRSGLITAMLLEWIRGGQIEFIKEEKKTLFSTKDIFKIHFKDSLESENLLEQTLYGYFEEAAGANRILENKEFDRWCAKNYKRLESWFEMVKSRVTAEWSNNGYTQVTEANEKFLFVFNVKVGKKLYTQKFREELHRTLGFKKFLLEFGSLGEKEVREVVLWEKYLIFASILGIADKVEREIGRLYPEFTNESYLDTAYTMRATRMFAYGGLGRAEYARNAAASRSSGGGGSSSFGGGGGSFSGGGGGGVR